MKFGSSIWRYGLALAAMALLSGCAAQMAYRDGQSLVARGLDREALARLEEASRLEPSDARYRIAVLQTRERVLAAQVGDVEAAIQQGKLQEAQDRLQHAMRSGLDAPRAQALGAAIDSGSRITAALARGRAAIEQNDLEAARLHIRSVLLEQPQHAEARALLQKVDRQPSGPAAPEGSLAAAYRKPITIEFKDAALKSVFDVVSRTSGLNFIFDKDVRTDQKTSIFLKNTSIESAIALTLMTNQLDQRVLDANTILIYPNTPAKQKEYQPLAVRSFYLSNGDAKTIAASLKSLLKTRDIVVDDKLNLLIMRDSPEAIRLAERIVSLHDVPEPEVMLEVEVLEVKRTSLIDVGVRWPSQVALSPLPSSTGASLTISDLRQLNSSRIGASVDPLTLRVNKTDSDANILANPRIRARNHEKAKVLIGARVPNITTTSTSTGFVAESVNYVDVGLKLEVEPTVYLEGDVAIKVSLEVSSIISQLQTKAGSIAYEIGTRTAQTVLRLKDGENQILAGLINDEERRSGNRVPGLGDIPLVGRLFGEQTNDSAKTEIVLSITPRIVRNVRRPDPAMLEFDSGTEGSLAAQGLRPTVQPPAIGAAAGGNSASTSSSRPAAGASQPSARPATPASSASNVVAAHSAGSTPASASQLPSPGAQVPNIGSATASLQGPNQVTPGQTFSVQVVLASEQPVVSVPFTLGFDPQVLQVVSISEGEFMRQGAAQSAFASRMDPKGQVLGTVTRSGNGGASGKGTLAVINFRVTGAAARDTQVRLISISPLGASGAPVVVTPAPTLSLPLKAGS